MDDLLSPHVQFTHPRLAEVAGFLAAQRAELVDAARSVPSDGWTDRVTPAGWSPAEIADHLRIVEHGVVRLVQKLVTEARAAGHPVETETSSVLDPAFIARTVDRTRPLEAPARVMPTRAADIETALASMQGERAELLEAMSAGDGLALGSLQWEHPVLGVLDLYEWLVFVGAHEGRHAAQLREIALAFAPRE